METQTVTQSVAKVSTPSLSLSDKVKALANSNPTAYAILLELAVRERHTEETDIQRFKMAMIRDGIDIIHEDFVSTFQAFEGLGFGKIIRPRKGANQSVIFHWNTSVKKVGQLAGFGDDVLKAKLNSKQAKKVIQKESVRSKAGNRKRRRKTVKLVMKKNPNFNRSEFMKAFWAKRRKGQPKAVKSKNDNVVKLLNEVLKQLKKSA